MSQSTDQRQQQLRNAYEYHQQQIKLATERILKERGADLELQAQMRELGPENPQTDPQLRREAAEEMARELAQRGVRSGNFNINDYRDVPDLGINRAEMARSIREEELARQQEAEREALSLEDDSGPSRPTAHTYADLKVEHADAIAPDLGGQTPEPGHEPVELAEEQVQESGPGRKYAELERAHAAAISHDGAEQKVDPEHEALESVDGKGHELPTAQSHADRDPAHAEGIVRDSDEQDVAPEHERRESVDEKALERAIDPTEQFELDLEDRELAEQLEFFEDLHPEIEHGMEH